MRYSYDVIVVGAGHAGCEAASAVASMGGSVLLITMDMNKIAQMSCNPAVGGIAKGQIVREIDALGGFMGIVSDSTAIQFRMLNKSKGPAMWSPRVQSDRVKFIDAWRSTLDSFPNLHIWQDTVNQLIIKNNKVEGVITELGVSFYANSVVLTNGTFLNGLLHIGRTQIKGGRISEPASYNITEQLKSYGFRADRMKTGTPVRVNGRSLDFSSMTIQEGDAERGHFSYLKVENSLKQRPCWITYTNTATHDILRNSLSDSPLYNGQIQSIGPRYCPSIETKIVTFADKNQHQLFVEPEGETTNEYYVNGFSSSLPYNVQFEALRTVPGFEKAEFYRPGYAIEYDFFDPTQLYHTLETKLIKNLFFAGQINGTTGYEEAAGQGIIAGINAFLRCSSSREFALMRDQAYIGVLIDDLVTKGVDEPYRMFTSRAEHRILLRQDNADERLTELSYNLGLASSERYNRYVDKRDSIEHVIDEFKNIKLQSSIINSYLDSIGESPVDYSIKIYDLLLRPNVTINSLLDYVSTDVKYKEIYSKEILEEVEIKIKYSGYIEREEIIAKKLRRLDYIRIPNDFEYNSIQSLSTEARQKLSSHKPKNIGEAARIPGISPNDVNVLLLLLGR